MRSVWAALLLVVVAACATPPASMAQTARRSAGYPSGYGRRYIRYYGRHYRQRSRHVAAPSSAKHTGRQVTTVKSHKAGAATATSSAAKPASAPHSKSAGGNPPAGSAAAVAKPQQLANSISGSIGNTGSGSSGSVAQSKVSSPVQPPHAAGQPPAGPPATASGSVQSAQKTPPAASGPAAISALGSGAVSSSARPADPALSQAKPDMFGPADTTKDHTLDNPLQVVGEGWKMVAYLLPTLLFILVCLHLIRRYQEKNGRLPGGMQAGGRGAARPGAGGGGGLIAAILGSQSSRRQGVSSGAIRLLESVPMGPNTLHLVKVHGRVLLLAGSNAGVTVLSEFEQPEGVASDEFQGMLQAATDDMDALDLAEPEMPVRAVVGSLDDVMRNTGDAMARRARRLRTVQEAEGDVR